MNVSVIRSELEMLTDKKVIQMHLLKGGCVVQVYHVHWCNGSECVDKDDPSEQQGLAVEGKVLY